jgi:hypothetical protein
MLLLLLLQSIYCEYTHDGKAIAMSILYIRKQVYVDKANIEYDTRELVHGHCSGCTQPVSPLWLSFIHASRAAVQLRNRISAVE